MCLAATFLQFKETEINLCNEYPTEVPRSKQPSSRKATQPEAGHAEGVGQPLSLKKQ